MLDIRPATDEVGRIVAGVTDDQLAATTPCSGLTVADLLDHVGGLSLAFAMAARKDPAVADVNGTFDGSRLADDWRDSIPAALDELATAWADPSAWDGMTAAGGVEMPGEVGGLVALDEVVVHGWDLAVASGQPFEIDAALLAPLHEFVAGFAEQAAGVEGLFGPQVVVGVDAPLLDRILGCTGRDPAWQRAM